MRRLVFLILLQMALAISAQTYKERLANIKEFVKSIAEKKENIYVENEYNESLAKLEREQISKWREAQHNEMPQPEVQMAPCPSCNNGLGIPGKCYFCKGQGGQIIVGFPTRCNLCNGTGLCGGCHGSGFIKDNSAQFYQEMEERNRMEYNQFRAGTGSTMSYEEYKAMKAQAIKEAYNNSSYSSSPNNGSSTSRSIKDCPRCGGSGTIIKTDAAGLGQSHYCSTCKQNVSGNHYHNTCPSCNGTGKY